MSICSSEPREICKIYYQFRLLGWHLMGDSERIITTPWKDSILDTIRQRPTMYMGQKSLTGLWFFLHGVGVAKARFAVNAPAELSPRFADWVGYRLHLCGNSSGFWHRAILSKVPDESLAFERFFELRDEFLRRQGRVVAAIREDCREYPVKKMGTDRQFVDSIESLPKSLNIVVYTEDPGFFLSCNEDEEFFFNGWFVAAFDASPIPIRDRFEVRDEDVWKRLFEENELYRQNLVRSTREEAAEDAGKSN
jgi:hypothetical protein